MWVSRKRYERLLERVKELESTVQWLRRTVFDSSSNYSSVTYPGLERKVDALLGHLGLRVKILNPEQRTIVEPVDKK